jgi:hypothetical protein
MSDTKLSSAGPVDAKLIENLVAAKVRRCDTLCGAPNSAKLLFREYEAISIGLINAS